MPNQFSVESMQEAFLVAMSNVLSTVIAFLPQLISAIIIILLGILVTGWIKKLVKKALQTINLESLFEKSPLEELLQQADIKVRLVDFITQLIGWLVIAVFFITAVNVLGLYTVSDFLTRVLAYLPRVFSAALILLVGVISAGFVESLVKGAIAAIDIATARLLGKVASYTVVVFAVLVALSELGIAANFINILFIGIVATLALGIGIAFGLGAKDIVREILSDWYKRYRKDLKKADK